MRTVLYPERKSQGLVCSKKRYVVPNQSMTLKEILQRFVRRESLPASKQGIYVDVGYDLEKVLHEDLVDQGEILNEVKAAVDSKRKRVEDLKPRPPAAPDPTPPVGPPPA